MNTLQEDSLDIMGLFKGILDGVVDVVALPVRAVSAVADEMFNDDGEFSEGVDRVVRRTKGELDSEDD